MSISIYDPSDRYKRRAARRFTNTVMITVFIVLSFCLGFWGGQIRQRQMMYILQEEARLSIEERDKMLEEMTALRAEAQTSNVRFEQLRASYETMLSDGKLKNLVNLLRDQINQGIDVKRLESVILSARPPQNCSDPESKRFVVITPVYSGPTSTVSVGNGEVIISATGKSAQSDGGNKEAWFDPGQNVEVTFSVRGEDPIVKKGNLPIYQSVVTNGKEYRFSITAGAKSFAKVTYDFCDYS